MPIPPSTQQSGPILDAANIDIQDAFENWIGFGTFGSLEILTFGLRDSFGSRGGFAGSLKRWRLNWSDHQWRPGEISPFFPLGCLIDNRWCKISEPSTVTVDLFTPKQIGSWFCWVSMLCVFAVVVPLLKLFEEVKNFLRSPVAEHGWVRLSGFFVTSWPFGFTTWHHAWKIF